MDKIFKFFESKIPRYLYVRNELFLLYLRGIRGIFEKRLVSISFQSKKNKIKGKGKNPIIFTLWFFPFVFQPIVLNISRIN